MNKPIPLAGYNGFNKRTGVADVAEGLGGRPRSLEFEDGVEAQPLVQSVSEADLEPVENVDENKLDSETEQSRRRRSLRDANGNRVLAVRRVKRETVEEDEAEEADIETERIIQVRCLILVKMYFFLYLNRASSLYMQVFYGKTIAGFMDSIVHIIIYISI